MIDFSVVCNGHRHTLSVEKNGTLHLDDHAGEAELAAEVLETLGAKFRCLDVKAAWGKVEPFLGDADRAIRQGNMEKADVDRLPPTLRSVLVNGYDEAAKAPELLATLEDRRRAEIQRRLTFVGGGSRKFWRIVQDGPFLVVRYGRIGTAGNRTEKSYGNAETAKREAEKMVAEKIRKGYRDA